MKRALSLVAVAFLILSTGTTRAQNEDAILDETIRSYHSDSEITLHPVTTKADGSRQETTLQIPAGSILTEIETQQGADGISYTRVGLDTPTESNLPTDFWLRTEELQRPELRLEIDNMRGMTYCYRYVKLYLLKKKMVKVYLPGGSAWMAKDILPKHGFKIVPRGPKNPKINDVCVYSGGTGGNGHIEVRAPQGWYYGYGYSAQPISLKGRRLIACYAK